MTNNIDAVAVLRVSLTEAAAKLRLYEASHRAKNTDDSNAKAEVNADLAGRFESILAATAHVADAGEQCVICYTDEPRTGTCSGPHDPRALCSKADNAAERTAAQPSPSDLIATHQVPKAKAMADLMQGAATQPAGEPEHGPLADNLRIEQTDKTDAVAVLREALTEAAATLRRYEVSHRAKNTDDSHVKAEVNADLAGRFESILAATERAAIQPAGEVVAYLSGDGLHAISMREFNRQPKWVKDKWKTEGCTPLYAAPISEATAPAAEDDQWHSLTCDGTCSPPCKDAPTLQRYVWAGAPAAPLKHLTAHEGPFYACADVDTARTPAIVGSIGEDAEFIRLRNNYVTTLDPRPVTGQRKQDECRDAWRALLAHIDTIIQGASKP